MTMSFVRVLRRPFERVGILLRAGAVAGLVAGGSLAGAVAAEAMDIEPVVSPGGIHAWLVHDDSVPIVAVNFAFKGGGSAQDPVGKEGLANLLSTLLDEGAADLDSEAYQKKLADLAIKLGFDAGRDSFSGSMQTLAANTPAAFDLLRLALTETRFDAEPISRMKAQIVSGLRDDAQNPGAVSNRLFAKTLFPEHPYGRPGDGTVESVEAIKADDLKAFKARIFARDNLYVGVVGAIDAKTLGALLDKTFGGLPAKADLTPVPDVVPVTGAEATRAMPTAQAILRFGLPGLKRADPDFIPAYVMNHILGGGTFTSWLFREVREKRGLTYGVETYLLAYDHAGVLAGGLATRPDKAAEAMKVIDGELHRMATDGPSAEELAAAKRFLIGSYPLRFDSSSAIAGQLLGIQLDGLGIDYVNKRNGLIEAVTLDDVKRVAKRLLDHGAPTVVSVTPPKG
ncbi:M16 family metallopeptidase [Segnochrobactrum spirostomi]|nr:pitrilysin family protein [Segnochrobactrum spirostomi]